MEKNKPVVKKERYFEASGGRKTATARVRIFAKDAGNIKVNDKDYREYFRIPVHQAAVISPLDMMKMLDKVSASVKVAGGGLSAQSEAVRNAIAKALVKFDLDFKKRLRKFGFLTRDSRMVERKKYGHKKARKSGQWQKR